MVRRKMTKLSDGGITMVTCLMAICLSVLTLTEAADEVFSCDFETSTRPPCSIVEDQTDDFNWDIGSGSTNSRSTGPDADHTIGTDAGQYFYIEVSGRTPGARATFDTPELQHAGPFCLTMWRSMFGHHIGTLTVYEVTDNDVTQKASWSHTENTNEWIKNRVEISSGTKKVRISATNGATTSGQPHGDIAVDDLVVTVGSCAATTTTSSTMPSTTITPTTEEMITTEEAETTTEETTTAEPTTTEPIETTEVPTTAPETTEASTQIKSTEETVETTVVTEPDTSTQSKTSEATTTVTEEVSDTSSLATSAFTSSRPSESTTEDTFNTKVTSSVSTVSSTRPDAGTTTADPDGGATSGAEEVKGEPLNLALVVGIAAAASVIFLIAIIVLIVLVRRRNRRERPPSSKGKDNESFDTDRDGTKVTGLSDTSPSNESSTDHIYNQIYSSLEGPTKPKLDSKPSPPLPKRNLPAPPTRPLPSPNEQPPPTLPRPNHTLPDMEPPRDLAPIPPMKNPLAGLDISPMQDEPIDSGWSSPPPPQSPTRHKKRRQRHRRREDEDDRRHHHRRRHRQHSNDDWDHPGSAHFSRTHDPRAKRKTLDVPVSPDYIPLTMGASPMQMDPVSNGYYGQDPYSPQTDQGNWNWTTIPRPRVFY